jgi:ankyrin repeat protein
MSTPLLKKFVTPVNRHNLVALIDAIDTRYRTHRLYDRNVSTMIGVFAAYDPNTHTILNATGKNNLTVLEYLLSTETQRDSLATALACERGYEHALRLLLQYGTDLHYNAIDRAIKHGHFGIVKYLHEYGTPMTGETIVTASRYGRTEILRYLLSFVQLKQESYALVVACAHGHYKVATLLIEAGFDVTAHDNMALRSASRNGHLPIVQLLVRHGADVHAHNSDALVYAAMMRHLHVVRYLVEECNADLTARNDTIYNHASINGNNPILRYIRNRNVRSDSNP